MPGLFQMPAQALPTICTNLFLIIIRLWYVLVGRRIQDSGLFHCDAKLANPTCHYPLCDVWPTGRERDRQRLGQDLAGVGNS